MVIHDAVYVEAPQEEEEQARHLMKVIMEDAVEMPVVPLEVDVETLSPSTKTTIYTTNND